MPVGPRIDSCASIELIHACVSAFCIDAIFSAVVEPLGASFSHAAWLTEARFQALQKDAVAQSLD